MWRVFWRAYVGHVLSSALERAIVPPHGDVMETFPVDIHVRGTRGLILGPQVALALGHALHDRALARLAVSSARPQRPETASFATQPRAASATSRAQAPAPAPATGLESGELRLAAQVLRCAVCCVDEAQTAQRPFTRRRERSSHSNSCLERGARLQALSLSLS